MPGKNTMIIVGAVIVIIVVVIIAAVLLSMPGTTTPYTTIPQGTNYNVTTSTPTTVAPASVKILVGATGANLTTCQGYNYSISQADYRVIGSCNWVLVKSGQRLEVTVSGGSYSSTLTLLQMNTNSTPYYSTTYSPACVNKTETVPLPVGDYNITFTTGSSTLDCGPATFRLTQI